MVLKIVPIITLIHISIQSTSAENILFLQPLPSKSHHIWNKQIFDRLYNNGHNLTILSFEPEKSTPGKTFLMIDNFMEKFKAEYDEELIPTAQLNPFTNIVVMYKFLNTASRILAKEDAIRQLLSYPKSFKFDLIIHDFTMGQFLLGFVEYFGNPPLVSISAFNIPSYVTTIADAPLYTTYMPHFSSGYDTRMNFLERAKNTLYWAFDIFYRNQIYMTNEDRRAKQLFGRDSTSVKVIEKRSDVILVNNDFSMDYYQPLPPNVIPVGGLHISRSEEVPPIVKQFIARAIKGVILVSFGTNIASENLGENVNNDMYKVFHSMPEYGFIWKHGNPETLGAIPPNLLVMKWVPQAMILAHPRTKLFISHAGLLSLQEATWHGVPVIAIPFFADQYSNADKIVSARVGVKLPLTDINEPNLKQTILQVVNDSRYHAKMKERSYLFKGQPDSPLDRAIFWIEKVIENKGLSYLRSPSHEMNIFQMYGLDMIGTVLLVAFCYYLIIRKHIRKVVSTDRNKPKKE
ncbi:UDP-glucosyltransferase 2-like [Toxorhynchites rutilus septentrionalis]|uniref:UDP-glucosyltransferase 2-like n=1 Tax=Toxorhynchites rutilus septentrionalis TaxID=329112 RepID=UPI00247A7F08|nr:UDP-glucosyltransferase 2-like [Toxorhynchites rutilus septentrionalis]